MLKMLILVDSIFHLNSCADVLLCSKAPTSATGAMFVSLPFMQDRPDGESVQLTSDEIFHWVPKCITGKTPWSPEKETPGNWLRGDSWWCSVHLKCLLQAEILSKEQLQFFNKVK